MNKTHVFYQLKNDQYKLQFENKTVFVEKDTWNQFINEQHGRTNEIVSMSGGIRVDLGELERIIG